MENHTNWCCRTCDSSIYTGAYEQVEKEFGVSQEVTTLGLSLFVLGLAVGPLFLSPLSEVCGTLIREIFCHDAD